MLTNANEFNAFLEAIGEQGRWHDPSKPALEPEPEPEAEPELEDSLTPESEPEAEVVPAVNKTVHRSATQPRPNPLHKVTQLAIENAGGLEAPPANIWNELLKLAESQNPPDELTGKVDRPQQDNVTDVTLWFFNFDREEKAITRNAFTQRIYRLRNAKGKD